MCGRIVRVLVCKDHPDNQLDRRSFQFSAAPSLDMDVCKGVHFMEYILFDPLLPEF
jgi:hypothetical protein